MMPSAPSVQTVPPPPAIRPVLCVSVAVVRAGRVLVAARTVPPMAGLYSLPGGKVEFGERLQEAALRELAEEVDVAAEIVGFADFAEIIRDENGTAVHAVVCAFAARWRGGEPQPGPEAHDPRWVLPADLASMPTTDGLQAIAARAVAMVEAAP